MSDKPPFKLSKATLIEFAKKNRYVLIVVAVGIVVIFWPSKPVKPPVEAAVTPPTQAAGSEIDYGLDALQRELASLLGSVQGVGRVNVMLTVSGSTETVYARDGGNSTRTGQGGEVSSENTSQVAVVRGAGGEQAVIVKTIYPSYTGAVVVCDGADKPEVALAITRAIMSLTGLSSDKITIMPMSN